MEVYTTEQGVRYRLYRDVHEFAGDLPRFPATYKSQRKKWIGLGAGMDIETTRVDDKAFMYHWQLSLGDMIILGRTWDQYDTLVYYLQRWLAKYEANIILWVANLGHEFSFLCNRYEWGKIFAREAHQPLTAWQDRIQYREALTLSGIGGLKNLAKNYTVTKKAVGDLDYNVLRNSKTPLTPKEEGYCINDVAILSEWGDYCLNRWIRGNKQFDRKIPLTATGICRDAVKAAAGKDLEKIVSKCRLDFPETAKEYNFVMMWLFRGGYTHANVFWVDEEIPDVIGADFTSSYPAVMVHVKHYPVGRFYPIDLRTDGVRIIDPKMEHLCVWMVVDLYDVDSKTLHHIESGHKILKAEGEQLDNGRLIRAKKLRVALTDVDYKIYTMFYTWSKIRIRFARGAKAGPLPSYLIKPLLDAYLTKCKLKQAGLDKTPEYANAKSIVNSFYGMTVTRLSFTDYTWTRETGWKPIPTDKTYYNLIKDQFLLPYYGIWITAWARYQLLRAVKLLDPDKEHYNVIYCDTDSIYMIGSPDNIAAIEQYNRDIEILNEELPPECADLGCFDWIDKAENHPTVTVAGLKAGSYEESICTDDKPAVYHFKTLGAKRYIKLDKAANHPTVTVAGLKAGSYEESICTDDKPAEPHFDITVEHFEDGEIVKETKYVTHDEFFRQFTARGGLLIDMYTSRKTTVKYSSKPYTCTIRGEEMHEEGGAAIIPISFVTHITEDFLNLVEYYQSQRRQRLW